MVSGIYVPGLSCFYSPLPVVMGLYICMKACPSEITIHNNIPIFHGFYTYISGIVKKEKKKIKCRRTERVENSEASTAFGRRLCSWLIQHLIII